MRVLLLALLASFAVAGRTSSQVVLADTGPVDYLGSTAFNLTDFFFASSFGIGAPANISGFRFWTLEDTGLVGAWFGSYVGSFAWAIYSDADGLPSVSLVSGETSVLRERVADDVYNSVYRELVDVYQNDLRISTSLTTGVYWLALHNGPLPYHYDDQLIGWARSSTVQGSAAWEDLRDGFQGSFTLEQPDGQAALTVYGTSTVPEPMSMALLGTGLAGLAAVRRRRRIDNQSV